MMFSLNFMIKFVIFELFAAMYAVTFKDITSAFATHGLWSAFGWVVAFGYSSYLCTSVKIYILISWLTLSAVGYVVAEILCHKDKQISYNQMD